MAIDHAIDDHNNHRFTRVLKSTLSDTFKFDAPLRLNENLVPVAPSLFVA
jgi:hypothetical protein